MKASEMTNEELATLLFKQYTNDYGMIDSPIAEAARRLRTMIEAQAEIGRLRDALDQIAKIYERDSWARTKLAQLFYDARCIARQTLSTENPNDTK